MLTFLPIIVGLALFEVISSLDNAVVNAHVLKTLPEKFRRFFLTWGILIAVVLVRGLLPFAIVWISQTSMSFGELWHTVWSGSEVINVALETSKPLLLVGGGTYLVFVFLSWLFTEEKKYAWLVEHFLHRQAVWFYAVASIFFTVIVALCVRTNPQMALAAAIGSMAFFMGDGFKASAQKKETELEHGTASAISKLLYLEVLDASFSIDGVVGAFAFTISVPLILLGNGLGALIVRQVTVRGINLIERYAYLKNGAMYSIGLLGSMMIFESFGHEYPAWLAPLNTVIILVVFIWLSRREIKLSSNSGSPRKCQAS